MTEFLIAVGILGLIISSFVVIAQWVDDNPLLYLLLTWGFFFALSIYGFHRLDSIPKKPETIQSLAMREYQNCLIQYDVDKTTKDMKITQEQLCASLNVIYQKNVLGVK